MKCIDRYNTYKDEDLDRVILLIRNGTIKCGRYAGMIKINKKEKMKGKVFFNDTKKD